MAPHPPVLVILSLLSANVNERAFFAAHPQCAANLLRAVADTPGLDQVVVVAEEGAILPAMDSKVIVARLPRDNRPYNVCLPVDHSALAAALAVSPSRDQEGVLYLDVRQPWLTAADLQRALNTFFDQSGLDILVSMRPVHDHPSQWWRYVRLQEQGVVHLFEPTGAHVSGLPPQLSHRVSRPVPVDWPTFPEWGQKTTSATALRLWNPADGADAHPIGSDGAQNEPVVWFADAEGALRVLVHPNQLEPDAAGIVHADLFRRKSRARGIFRQPSGVLTLNLGGDDRPAWLLVAGCPTVGPAGEAVRLTASPGSGPVRLTPEMVGKAPAMLLFTLLNPVEDGPFDASIPFFPEQAPWGWNRSGALVAQDGAVWLGRQDFPLVLMPEPGLLLFSRDRPLASLAAALSAGQVRAFPLERAALTINTSRDAALAACWLSATLLEK